MAGLALLVATTIAAGPWLSVTYIFDQQQTELVVIAFDGQPVIGALLAVALMLLVLALWLRGGWRYLIAALAISVSGLLLWQGFAPELPSAVTSMVEKASGLAGADAIQTVQQLNRWEYSLAVIGYAVAVSVWCLRMPKAPMASRTRSRFSRGDSRTRRTSSSGKDYALDLWDDQRN